MNEVRLGSVSAVFSSASSKGAANAKSEVSTPVPPPKVEPKEEVEPTPKEQASSAEKLSQQVARVNDYVQSVQRDLQFSVDEDLDRTVIRVVDGDSGELIRQIPEDIFLELARRLEQNGIPPT